jgi:hypothetical protein
MRPRKKNISWGGRLHEVTLHDLVLVNPNDSIQNPELKTEADLLPLLADFGRRGNIKYLINVETLLETLGLPGLDSQTGKFYGTPYDVAEPPIRYSRIALGLGVPHKRTQFEFLSSIREERFIELQKMTGAYQGEGKLNRNQLLDAFHIWCAEHNDCQFFLTLDFKLIRLLRNNKGRQILVRVLKPSELLERLTVSV